MKCDDSNNFPGICVVKLVGLKNVRGFIMLRIRKHMPKSDGCECSQLAVKHPNCTSFASSKVAINIIK